MLTYAYLLLLTPILNIVSACSKNKDRVKKLLTFIIFFQMMALLALRAKTVGTDTATTMNIFMSVFSSGGEERTFAIAPAYFIYCYLIYSFFPFGQAITIFNAVITLTCIFFFIRRFSDNIFMSIYSFIALGYFFQCFNASRQYLAMSIILLSLCFICSGKIKLAFFLAISACGVHIIVSCMLPLLILFYYKKVTNIILIIITMIIIIVSFFYDIIIDSFLNVFLMLYPSYEMYAKAGTLSFGNEGQGRIVWLLLFYCIILLLSLYIAFTTKTPALANNVRLFFVPVAISVMIGLMGTRDPLFARLSSCYSIFIICLIPSCMKAFCPKSKIFLYTILVLILTVPFYITLASNHGDVLPYRFFFWDS